MVVHYDGIFDFSKMYAAVIDWGKSHGYMWHEVDYKHKVPGGRVEQEFKWLMTKEVTEYLYYKIFITVHMWEVQDVEVEIKGKKKTITKGRIMLWMDGTLRFDWQKRFKGGWFPKLLERWYLKIREHGMVSEQFDVLYYRMQNLQTIIKKNLEMEAKEQAYKGYLKED